MENGEHVTRAEMREALEPIRSDIVTIKNDVRSLLLSDAGRNSVSRSRTSALSLVLSLIASLSALAAVIVAFAH